MNDDGISKESTRNNATLSYISQEVEEDAQELQAYENSRPRPQDYTGLLRRYVVLGNWIYDLVNTGVFSTFIMTVIFCASALVGVQTYDGMEEKYWVQTADLVILIIFSTEIVLKILSETTRPHFFFYGSPNWAWNDFDLCIVLLCMPILPLGNSAAVLRMLRLARALRVARIIVLLPNLRVLIYGIAGGLSSIAHTGILIVLIVYIYGLSGVFFFAKNDPFHFKNLGLSATTLLRMATLDNWIDVYYINYYGCASADMYATDKHEAAMDILFCKESTAHPFLSSVYFISYIILAFMILLSMFVGAISISMAAGIEKIQHEALERRKKRQAEHTSRILSGAQDIDFIPDDWEKAVSACSSKLLSCLLSSGPTIEEINHKRQIQALLIFVWDGNEYRPKLESRALGSWEHHYFLLSLRCKDIVQSAAFNSIILGVIVSVGVMVGIQSNEDFVQNNKGVQALFHWLSYIIVIIFTLECIMKVVAEGFRPFKYFNSNWNRFDFVVLVGSYLPGGGNMIMLLRLMRLMLVLKLVNQMPGLRTVIESLWKGVASIGYIGLLMFMMYYLFAIVGVILFKFNDPYHFGNLHIALRTLFICGTMEGWTDIMYVNMFGCDKFMYNDGGEMLETCLKEGPDSWGYLATCYFVIFETLAAMVVLNLFLGVITNSMTQATADVEEERILQNKVKTVMEKNHIHQSTVDHLYELYVTVDHNLTGWITVEELHYQLVKAGLRVSAHEVQSRLDTAEERLQVLGFQKSEEARKEGLSDFSHFLQLMIDSKIGHERNNSMQEEVPLFTEEGQERLESIEISSNAKFLI